MLVDMHLHALPNSTDSFLTLEEIVSLAKLRGLDAVCLTDHDSMGGREYAEDYSRKTDFPIFVGVEYFSLWGDITAWGIDTFPDQPIEAQTFIDQVNAAGGFCVSAHPFRNNNRGFEDRLREARGLHGVEVLNGSTNMDANRKALAYCRELGLKAVGASDSHVPKQVGKYVTWLPEKVDNLKDFVSQLHSCETRPAIFNGIDYDVVETF